MDDGSLCVASCGEMRSFLRSVDILKQMENRTLDAGDNVGESGTVKSAEVVYLPFDKTRSVTTSRTITS